MGLAHSPRVVTDGLVLCLDAFNKKGGLSIVQDLSNNGNNGTLTNGVIRNINGSIAFDGNGDAITTPSTTNLNLSATNNFTIEGWFRCNSLKNGNTVLSLGTGMSSLYWVMGVGYSGGELFFGNGSGSWGWTQLQTTSGAGVVAGIWTHVAVVRNGSTLTIFKDGISVYTNASWNFGSGQGGTLHIGTYFNNANNDGSWFDGAIYNLRIVSGTSVYTNNFTPSAYYGYISGTILLVGRLGILDESDAPRSLTTAGNVSAISSDDFSFDGINDRIQTISPFGNVDWAARAWSFSCFMKLTAQGNRCIVDLNSATTSDYAVTNVFWGDGKSYWYFIKNSTPTQTNFTQSSGVFTNNEIFQFTMTYNGNGLSNSNVNFYKNDTLLTTVTGGSASITNRAGVWIGGYDYPFQGNVYDFRMYNKALTLSDVKQNFNALRGRYGI